MDPLQISILAIKKILINIGSSELMKSFEQGNEKIAHVNVSTKQGETSSYDKIRNTILLQKKLKDDLYEQALAKQKRANEENIDSSIAIA